jgi:hypothetical protein
MSVVNSVYNCDQYLAEAIQSVPRVTGLVETRLKLFSVAMTLAIIEGLLADIDSASLPREE